MTLEQLNESIKYGGLGGYTVDEHLKTYLPDVYEVVFELEQEKEELEDSLGEYQDDLTREEYNREQANKAASKAMKMIDNLSGAIEKSKQELNKSDIIEALGFIKETLVS